GSFWFFKRLVAVIRRNARSNRWKRYLPEVACCTNEFDANGRFAAFASVHADHAALLLLGCAPVDQAEHLTAGYRTAQDQKATVCVYREHTRSLAKGV